MARTNWNKTIWEQQIQMLPRGWAVKAVAKLLGKPYAVTHLWLKHFKYQSPDSRGLWRRNGRHDPSRKLLADKVDWSQPDAEIARQFKVSRQRVGVVRKEHNKTNHAQ